MIEDGQDNNIYQVVTSAEEYDEQVVGPDDKYGIEMQRLPTARPFPLLGAAPIAQGIALLPPPPTEPARRFLPIFFATAPAAPVTLPKQLPQSPMPPPPTPQPLETEALPAPVTEIAPPALREVRLPLPRPVRVPVVSAPRLQGGRTRRPTLPITRTSPEAVSTDIEASRLIVANAYTFRDQLYRASAQLSLSAMPGQFPAIIYLRDPQRPSEAPQVFDLDAMIDTVVDRAVHGWTPSGYVPSSTLSPVWSSTVTSAPSDALQDPNVTKVVKIDGVLSTGTAQGEVYRAHVDANPDVPWTSAPQPITPNELLSAGPLPPIASVPTAMKKSAIYSERLWLELQLARMIQDEYRKNPARLGALIYTPFGTRIRACVRDIEGDSPDVDPRRRALISNDFVEQRARKFISDFSRIIQSRRDILAREYSDLGNEPYVDAIGYTICSRIADQNLSPFFTLCYETMRAYDERFFSPRRDALYGGRLNQDFPVQVVFQQALSGGVLELFNTYFLGDSISAGGRNQRRLGDTRDILPERVYAFWAQVVFGLSAFQTLARAVHNDLHLGNLLYERVNSNAVLYYWQQEPGAPAPTRRPERGDIVWRVPTNGMVVKLIDFGRSSFALEVPNKTGQTLVVETDIHKSIHARYDNRLLSTDMIRSTLCFARYAGKRFMDQYTSPSGTRARPNTPEARILEMMSRVLRCSGGLRLELSKKHCTIDDKDWWVYERGSPCRGGIPGTLFDLFDLYRVQDPSTIPATALVYPVWHVDGNDPRTFPFVSQRPTF